MKKKKLNRDFPAFHICVFLLVGKKSESHKKTRLKFPLCLCYLVLHLIRRNNSSVFLYGFFFGNLNVFPCAPELATLRFPFCREKFTDPGFGGVADIELDVPRWAGKVAHGGLWKVKKTHHFPCLSKEILRAFTRSFSAVAAGSRYTLTTNPG